MKTTRYSRQQGVTVILRASGVHGWKDRRRWTPKQALVREIREELEADIEVGKLIDTIEYDYPKFHLSMNCF